MNNCLETTKENFTDWWSKNKIDNPIEATVESSITATTSGIAGGLCIGNGFKKLATSGGVIGPILSIVAGLGFTFVSIKSTAEAVKLYKQIKSKEKNEEEEEKDDNEN